MKEKQNKIIKNSLSLFFISKNKVRNYESFNELLDKLTDKEKTRALCFAYGFIENSYKFINYK